MPYSVPEGYFGTFGEEMAGRIEMARESKPKLLQKFTPYMATAAMFAMIVTAGTFFLRLTAGEYELTFEDYVVMSENLTGPAGYSFWSTRQKKHIWIQKTLPTTLYIQVSAPRISICYTNKNQAMRLNMKPLILAALVLICAAISAGASEKGDWKQKMMSEKIAFLTVELNLTPEEAQAFWPVYNQICAEFDTVMGEIFKAQRAMSKAIGENKSEAEISALLDRYLSAQQKQREINASMAERYRKVLPESKVAKLYISEEKFRRQCIHRMHNKPEGVKKPQNCK